MPMALRGGLLLRFVAGQELAGVVRVHDGHIALPFGQGQHLIGVAALGSRAMLATMPGTRPGPSPAFVRHQGGHQALVVDVGRGRSSRPFQSGLVRSS